ncbi:MAG: methyl-accepting chemotaxis protein [Lachnospiraceae bacterium]|nr:methyl-accepting chemotaxis protein [Lachnospiraceae bacterium]
MKFKSIRTKMLSSILPVVIVALLLLTIVAATTCYSLVEDQISQTMDKTLEATSRQVNGELDQIRSTASTLARSVQSTYRSVDMSTYESMLADIVKGNDIISGSGLWFAPRAYSPSQEYMGPYVYRDGAGTTTTYDYSNAEYDYFNQEYYLLAKEAEGAIITDPYYDPTSGTIMSTCSMPMRSNGSFIGCVTVDITLDTIRSEVESIKIGKAGSAMLLNSQGVYIAGASADKIQNAVSILTESNSSLQKAGQAIMASDLGTTSYTADNGIKYNLYFYTMEGTGWHIAVQMPVSELNAPVYSMLWRLILVAVISIIAAAAVILLLVANIARSIGKVKHFAELLSSGDFTIDPMDVKDKDELGAMGNSLNSMFQNNRGIISNISEHSAELSSSSSNLEMSAAALDEKFKQIQEYMSTINEAMMNTSAASEQVNASTEEVNANVSVLANETDSSMSLANEIKVRADDIGKSSRDSYNSASQLSAHFEENLRVSLEKAKVVENIGQLASSIAEIAEQINLLSLNASIEAARAGEQGKGFAVVATEIGKLASDTTETVDEIQNTITEVQEAFRALTEDADSILKFIQETVTPDYNKFVGIADQYGRDADSMHDTSLKISEMAENIHHVMDEVTTAIQNIAESSQDTADASAKILSSVDEVSEAVDQVSTMSSEQQRISEDLSSVVSHFRL